MSKKSGGPDLRKLMDKRMNVVLNGNRRVTGYLAGFDQYMNLVLDRATEQVSNNENNEIGMVVIRGNSIVMIEPLERVQFQQQHHFQPQPH